MDAANSKRNYPEELEEKLPKGVGRKGQTAPRTRGCRHAFAAPTPAVQPLRTSRDEGQHRRRAHHPRVDDPRRRAVKARHQARELLREHALGNCRRAANVRKQHRDLDLSSPGVLVNRAYAPLTDPSVQWRRALADSPHQDAAGPTERALQSLQRGGDGTTPQMRRMRGGKSPVSILPHISSGVSLAIGVDATANNWIRHSDL